MPRSTKNNTWSMIKNALKGWDSARLTELVHDLYQASPENRRFLHARLVGAQAETGKYRRLIEDAIYPSPRAEQGDRRTRRSDAQAQAVTGRPDA